MQLNVDILLSFSDLLLSQPLSQSVGRGFESQRKCWDFSSLKNGAISAQLYIYMYIYIPANFDVRIKRTPLTRVGLGMSGCACAVGAEIACNSIQTFF